MSRYGGDTTRVVYRERDSEGSTVARSAPRSNNEGYTTRKTVYRVSNQDEEEDRTPAFLAPRERTYGETRIVRRERTPEPEPVVERREIRIRERTPEPEPIVERREIRIERDREPEPEPRRYETEYRYDRDIDRVAPRRDDLERYVRTVDYYPRQEAPQPIIIRQEPQQIIIQEAPRPPIVMSPPPPTTHEENFEIIKRSEARSEVGHRSESHRSEVGEERQIARRPKPPKPEPEEEEEDYYYEKRTRRIDGRDRDDEEYESSHRRRDRERDVSPGDSISQYGRDRRRDYDSDSSYEYIRRETREDYSDDEPRHRRHLAEGAAVGLGAAELLRHHRKKKGEDEGGRGSRVGKDVGAAALGAIGAEAVTRARSHYRSKSRRGSRDRESRDRGSRSRDRDRDREGRRKHKRDKSRGKERSRSESNHRVRNLAGLGLGAAAVAAAVGYANRNAKKNEVSDRRSRSRTRRDSVGALPAPEEADDARNASHRNKKIAQAGLAGAAVAGLVERARSKSRGGGKRDRSKSRIRQGLPIAATALGSAAVAGLYEKQQAGKKEKEARREERAARRSARSRSRSQPYEGSREMPAHGEPGLIEYGQDQFVNQGGVPDYYNRPASQQGYYNNTEDAMVPAAAAGAAYGAQAQRDVDRSQRQRSLSSESENGRRRRRHRRHKSGSRSRSRSRNATTAALAAGAAGLAASEHEKRKQRKREKKEERKRQELAEQASYGQDPYAQQQYQPNSPPVPGYPIEGQQNPYYTPPPGQEYPGITPAPTGQIHPDYYQAQTGYAPPVPDAYSPPPGAAGYPPQNRQPTRADENVSAELFHNTANNDVPLSSNDAPSLPNLDVPLYDSNGAPFYHEPSNLSGEGVNPPPALSLPRPSRPGLQRRASSQPPPRTKTVQFALDSPPSSRANSPTQIRKRRQQSSSSKHSRHDGHASEEDDSSSRKGSSHSSRRDHHRSSSNDQLRSSSPGDSDSTVELPERFDERGRSLPQHDDDPMAHIEKLLGGGGSVGRLLQHFVGGESDDGDGDRDRDRDGDRDGDRRRHRR